MFRSSKAKKKKTTIRRTVRSDDEEEPQQSHALQKASEQDDNIEKSGEDSGLEDILALKLQKERQNRKKKKKNLIKTNVVEVGTSRTTVLTGGSKMSRKRQRIGFGGASNLEEDEEEDENEAQVPVNSLYDANALAQLKAEQDKLNQSIQQKNDTKAPIASQRTPQSQESQGNDDFIPLNGNRNTPDLQHSTILAGDEALETTMDIEEPESSPQAPTKGQSRVAENANMEDSNAVEDSNMWQGQIEKRAGILDSSSNEKRVRSQVHLSSTKNNNILSLGELRQQFVEAQSSLTLQIEDVANSCNRRQADIQHTKEKELQQHSSNVKSCGEAVEFYQTWRAQAVPHVAALRELADKVGHVQTALAQAMADTTRLAEQRRQLYTDDDIASLRPQKVIGHQLNPACLPTEEPKTKEEIDEFGRHVPSQQALQREKRGQERHKIELERQQRQENETHFLEDLGYWMLNSEIEAFREQTKSLLEAIEFAMSQVREDYRSLPSLVRLFSEWYKHNPQEYNDCYAGLSLADLAAVLVRIETCQALLKGGNIPEHPEWIKAIQEAKSTGALDNDALLRLSEKSICSLLTDIIGQDERSSFVRSQAKTWLDLSKLAISIAGGNVASSTEWKTLVGQPLLESLKSAIDSVSLPIFEAAGSFEAFATEKRTALAQEQLDLVDRLLHTIFEWKTVLDADQFDTSLAAPVLNFLQNDFLLFLSSLKGTTTELASRGARTYLSIHDGIESTGWLTRPEFLIQATTLQAVAEVYQVE